MCSTNSQKTTDLDRELAYTIADPLFSHHYSLEENERTAESLCVTELVFSTKERARAANEGLNNLHYVTSVKANTVTVMVDELNRNDRDWYAVDAPTDYYNEEGDSTRVHELRFTPMTEGLWIKDPNESVPFTYEEGKVNRLLNSMGNQIDMVKGDRMRYQYVSSMLVLPPVGATGTRITVSIQKTVSSQKNSP